MSGRSGPKSRRDNSHPGREGPGRISLQKMTGLGFTTAIDIAFSSLLHQRERRRDLFIDWKLFGAGLCWWARGIKIVKGFKILKISAAQCVVKQSLPGKQKFLTHFTLRRYTFYNPLYTFYSTHYTKTVLSTIQKEFMHGSWSSSSRYGSMPGGGSAEQKVSKEAHWSGGDGHILLEVVKMSQDRS